MNSWIGPSLMFLFLIGLPAWGGEGGSESHGGGESRDRHNVWFLGDETVHYCVDVVDGSPYTKEEYSKAIRESIDEWVRFFKSYGYDRYTIGNPESGLRFPDGKPRKMSLNFEEIERCSKPREQIRFAIRPEPPGDTSEEGPAGAVMGAAIRHPYNFDTFRTGGTVWIDSLNRAGKRRPMWVRKHILLHELGHVFGMRHNEVWVMYEKAAYSSFEAQTIVDGAFSPDLGKIELPAWKFRLKPGDALEFLYRRVVGAGAIDERLPVRGVRYEGLNRNGEKRFTLLMDPPDGSAGIVEYPGTFDRHTQLDPQMLLGPSVFALWNWASDPSGEWKEPATLNFFPFPDALPAVGYFEVGGRIHPASLEFKYGATLKLFVPHRKQWQVFTGEPYRQGIRNELDR